jgi:hypothetical protein
MAATHSTGTPAYPTSAELDAPIPYSLTASGTQAAAQVSPQRLAPAVVDGAVIYVDCPAWCTTDHTTPGQLLLEDITHHGQDAALLVSSRESAPDFLAYAGIVSEPFCRDTSGFGASIRVHDQAAVEEYLTPDMADRLADDLVAFAARVRDMARTVREGGAS